ncbi:MAG: hypothetical protein K1X42_05735 [Opitutaceae bacterium]|nr:hypothetical protein [Opitutaceae bacterium]
MMCWRNRGMLVLGIVCLAFAGCESVPRVDHARTGPFYIPTNVRGVDRFPATVKRIAILPVAGLPEIPEENLARLDSSFSSEFNRSARAEAVLVSRDLLARLAGARQLTSVEVLPHDLLSRLKGATSADAILFIDLTAYSPYPPLKLGIRSKLVDIASGEILWAFDNLFDANEPAVANAARRHYLDSNASEFVKGDLSSTVLQNPTRFGSYVAFSTFVTLPKR